MPQFWQNISPGALINPHAEQAPAGLLAASSSSPGSNSSGEDRAFVALPFAGKRVSD